MSNRKLENTKEVETDHFNVKHSLRINGQLFLTAISYALPEAWRKELTELQEQGKVILTHGVVAFQNGRPVDEKYLAAENKVFGRTK